MVKRRNRGVERWVSVGEGGCGRAGLGRECLQGGGCSRHRVLTRQSRVVKVRLRRQSRGGNTAEEELWWMIDWIRRAVCSCVEAVVFGVLVSAFYRAESQRVFLLPSAGPRRPASLAKALYLDKHVDSGASDPILNMNSARPVAL